MDGQDNITAQSPAERQLRRLIVPARGTCDPSRRIDFVHDPDLDLLWGDVG